MNAFWCQSRDERILMGCLLVAGLAIATAAVAAAGQNMTTVDETGLRRLAEQQVRPQYPAGSVKAGSQGVAVAEVVVRPNGTVERVTVLQSPDESIEAAMTAALSKWTFRSLGESVPAIGKMTFYFSIDKGRGVVASPEQLRPQTLGKPGTGSEVRRVESRVPHVTEPELAGLARGQKYQRLDIRDRIAFSAKANSGVVNIPLDEVAVRVPIEVSRSSTEKVVIDCTYELGRRCDMAAHILTEERVPVLAIIVAKKEP